MLIAFLTLILAIVLFLPGWLERKATNSYQFLWFLFFGLPVSGICMGIDLTVGIQACKAREHKLIIAAAGNLVLVLPMVFYYLFYIALS